MYMYATVWTHIALANLNKLLPSYSLERLGGRDLDYSYTIYSLGANRLMPYDVFELNNMTVYWAHSLFWDPRRWQAIWWGETQCFMRTKRLCNSQVINKAFPPWLTTINFANYCPQPTICPWLVQTACRPSSYLRGTKKPIFNSRRRPPWQFMAG